MTGDYDQELAAAQMAFRLHPDEGSRWLSVQSGALAALGRVDELEGILDQIEGLNDLRWVRSAPVEAAEILRAHGRVEAGLKFAGRAIERFDARPTAEATEVGHGYWYGRALFLAGRVDESHMVFDEIVNAQSDSLSYRAFRAFLAVQRGDTAQATRDAEWLDEYVPPDVPGAGWRISPLYWQGVIAAALGERQQAVDFLRESYDQGRLHDWYDGVRVEFESLRDHPDFQELMRPKG
jgi:tetratricopeptide (TPR) repeat protein